MTPAEYADLLHGKKPKRLGLKKAKEEHIINWTPNSNSQEPYIIGERYEDYQKNMHTMVDRQNYKDNFNGRVVYVGEKAHKNVSKRREDTSSVF